MKKDRNHEKLNDRKLVLLVAIVWTVALLLGSSMPPSKNSTLQLLAIPGFDKIAHFIAYMGFVFWWARVLNFRKSKVTAARLAFYISLLLGLLIEFLQHYVFVGRFFEIYDIIANISGSIVGLIAFYKLFK